MKGKFLPKQMDEFMACVEKNVKNPAGLMPSVHDAQRIFGGVPLEIQKIIGEHHKVSVSKVSGIVGFYDYFTSDIQGEHIVEVCVGTSCYVNEAMEILNYASELTNCKPNSTSKDKKFSLIIGRCLGMCEFGPNVIINHKTHMGVNKVQLKKLIEGLK